MPPTMSDSPAIPPTTPPTMAATFTLLLSLLDVLARPGKEVGREGSGREIGGKESEGIAIDGRDKGRAVGNDRDGKPVKEGACTEISDGTPATDSVKGVVEGNEGVGESVEG